MWDLMIGFLIFAGGMLAGVIMMCLSQAGKYADEQMENMKWRDNE